MTTRTEDASFGSLARRCRPSWGPSHDVHGKVAATICWVHCFEGSALHPKIASLAQMGQNGLIRPSGVVNDRRLASELTITAILVKEPVVRRLSRRASRGDISVPMTHCSDTLPPATQGWRWNQCRPGAARRANSTLLFELAIRALPKLGAQAWHFDARAHAPQPFNGRPVCRDMVR